MKKFFNKIFLIGFVSLGFLSCGGADLAKITMTVGSNDDIIGVTTVDFYHPQECTLQLGDAAKITLSYTAEWKYGKKK